MSFPTALSGIQAANSDIEVHGNNIANASTTGFKESRTQFSDVFASSGLGVSSNSIGTGVRVSSVSQQFTQGNITATSGNLDLAINGNGFFVLNDSGTLKYSRAGAFGVDKDGFVSNSQLQRLQGFITDASGNISGATGDLKIQNGNIAPNATSTIDVGLNLQSSLAPPASPFIPGFTAANLPGPTTYNNSTSMKIYDSLGNEHILSMYYVKTHIPNTWHAYVGIDNEDVTPSIPALPNGGAGPYPQVDTAGVTPSPFTIVFDQNGNYIPNSVSSPPQYYGPSPATSNVTSLSAAGSLVAVGNNDLKINGVLITPTLASSDIFSTTDKIASSISIVAAINKSSALHGVTATSNANTFTLTAPTYGALAAGNLVINGVSITGANANQAALVTLVNAQSLTTGVIATISGSDVLLTASDGRNIELATNGGAVAATFTSFVTTGGAALDEVQRGTYNLANSGHEAIIIGGNSPGHAAQTTGTKCGTLQSTSDIISIPSWDPATGATSPQALTIATRGSTQYSSSFAVQSLSQNGFTTGRLAGVQVSSTGILTASYGNGQTRKLGQVALASFSNSQGLQPLGDSSWTESFSSGIALLGFPGTSSLGLIEGGALEDSNVDLTNELVSLIVAQRNFQASAQTIRTSDAVTQTIINIR
jgi:flagellar hook protein FlgE